MKIAIDLDGVVYDFHGAYRLMLREYRGIKTSPVEEWWNKWNAQEQWGNEVDHKWMWDKGIDLGLFRYGHIIKGAIIGLKKLYDNGHELIIITHRPKKAIGDTLTFVSYISSGMFSWSGIHIFSNQEPKSLVEADILIDDKPENILDWENKNRKGLLFNRPWNTERNEKFTRVASWEEVYAKLEK